MGGTPAKIVYDKVEVKTTRDNLQEPIAGEKQETEVSYPEFVKVAKPAEEQVVHLADVPEARIEEHEAAAGVVMVLMTAAGLASLLALLPRYRSGS